MHGLIYDVCSIFLRYIMHIIQGCVQFKNIPISAVKFSLENDHEIEIVALNYIWHIKNAISN